MDLFAEWSRVTQTHIEPSHNRPTGATKPVKMTTRTRKAKMSLLDDRIDILNGDAAKASTVKQVFRTVSTAIALVRVSAPSCVRLWALVDNQLGRDD